MFIKICLGIEQILAFLRIDSITKTPKENVKIKNACVHVSVLNYVLFTFMACINLNLGRKSLAFN